MKKLFLILPVAVLAACSSEQKTLVSGCEKIIASETGGDIYKCPMTEEFVKIQAMDADSMFGSIDGLDMANVIFDTEHAYVNVYGTCENPKQVQYRVMVRNLKIDGDAMYAVSICN